MCSPISHFAATITAKRTLDPDLAKTFDTKMQGMSSKIRELGDVMAPWQLCVYVFVCVGIKQ